MKVDSMVLNLRSMGQTIWNHGCNTVATILMGRLHFLTLWPKSALKW